MRETGFDHHDPDVEALMHDRAVVYDREKRASLPLPVTSRSEMLAVMRAADPTSDLDGPDETEIVLDVWEYMQAIQGWVDRWVVEFFRLGRTTLKATGVMSALGGALDEIAGCSCPPQDGATRPARRCPAHGDVLVHGQCRRCQRALVRSSSRRAGTRW